jgi:acyl carrier protein
MGLDFVELILEIEDEFGIELDTEIVNHAETFGDMVDGVYQKITTKTYDTKDYGITLLKLQEELKKLVPKQQNFDENTKLSRLIPFWQRHNVSNSLQELFPMLSLPSESDIIGLIRLELILLLADIVLFSLSLTTPEPLQILLIISVCCITGVLGILFVLIIIIILINCFPSKKRIRGKKRIIGLTIHEMAQTIVKKTNRLEQMTKQECEEILRKILCKTLNLKPEEVKLESKLIEDLAIG